MIEVDYKGIERFKRLSQLELINGIVLGEIKGDSPARRSNPDWSGLSQFVPVSSTVAELINNEERALLASLLQSEVHRFYTATNTGIALVAKPTSKVATKAPGKALAKAGASKSTKPVSSTLPDAPTAAPAASSLGEPLGLHRLRECAARLAGWKWADLKMELRVLWLQAWLTELGGDLVAARAHYETYLKRVAEVSTKHNPQKDVLQVQINFAIEPNLTLLALNNFTVLSLRTAGIHHPAQKQWQVLARLAIQRLLPGACLSLMNLLDLAWEHRDATGDSVPLDGIRHVILTEYQLLENLYLGKKPAAKDKDKEKEAAKKQDAADETAPRSEAAKEEEEVEPEPDDRYRAAVGHWTVLRHLKSLQSQAQAKPKQPAAPKMNISKPAAHGSAKPATQPARDNQNEALENGWRKFVDQAGAIAYHSASEAQTQIVAELQLWSTKNNLLFKAPPPRHKTVEDLATILSRHQRYGEAVSILYPRDLEAGVPSGGTARAGTAAPLRIEPVESSDTATQIRELLEQGELDAAERLLNDWRQT